MFVLSQKDTPELKIMFVGCYCGKKITFSGEFCPVICPHCSGLLPDAIAIHSKDKERIVYHLDKEIWE